MARTKRSIKTVSALNARGYRCSLSQKEPSAKRCIKTQYNFVLTLTEVALSESTERQTVH